MGLAVFLGALCAGAKIIHHERFRARDILDGIASERPNVFIGVPTMYADLEAEGAAARDLSSIQLWISAADVMPPERARRFQRYGAAGVIGGRRVGTAVFLDVYGMVELSGAAAVRVFAPSPVRDVEVPPVSFMLPGFEARVVDERGEPLRWGSTGALQMRGPGVLRKYEGAPGAGPLPGGWFATGDLARVWPGGLFTFMGRSRDRLKVGGFSVFPAEVETFLREHPDVADVVLVGVPDPRMGDRPVALIVPAREPFDTEAFLTWAADKVAAYRRPRAAVVVASLPRGHNGKVDRAAATRMAVGGRAPRSASRRGGGPRRARRGRRDGVAELRCRAHAEHDDGDGDDERADPRGLLGAHARLRIGSAPTSRPGSESDASTSSAKVAGRAARRAPTKLVGLPGQGLPCDHVGRDCGRRRAPGPARPAPARRGRPTPLGASSARSSTSASAVGRRWLSTSPCTSGEPFSSSSFLRSAVSSVRSSSLGCRVEAGGASACSSALRATRSASAFWRPRVPAAPLRPRARRRALPRPSRQLRARASRPRPSLRPARDALGFGLLGSLAREPLFLGLERGDALCLGLLGSFAREALVLGLLLGLSGDALGFRLLRGLEGHPLLVGLAGGDALVAARAWRAPLRPRCAALLLRAGATRRPRRPGGASPRPPRGSPGWWTRPRRTRPRRRAEEPVSCDGGAGGGAGRASGFACAGAGAGAGAGAERGSRSGRRPGIVVHVQLERAGCGGLDFTGRGRSDGGDGGACHGGGCGGGGQGGARAARGSGG